MRGHMNLCGWGRVGTLVLAMRHPGREFRTNPPPTAQIAGGEILIVIGDSGQVAALRALAAETMHRGGLPPKASTAVPVRGRTHRRRM